MTADTDVGLYRTVFESAPDPIMVHDPETGVVVQVNAAACDLLGRDREDLVGSRVGSFSPWEFTSEDAMAAIETAAAEGTAEVDWSVIGPDGDRKWVNVRLERATVDGEARVVAFISELSDGHDRDGVQWDEQLRTLVDNLPVVVFTLAPDGRFTNVAGKGLESLGAGPADLVGVSVFDAYAEYPDIMEAAERALDGEEVRVTQPVDELVFETWYRPVVADGELQQVVGVARDISELKRREERVETLSAATNDLLYTHTEAAVAERVTEIAERIIDRPIAAMWSYDAERDVLSPVGATAATTDLAGVDIAKELPEMRADSDEKAIFDAGEPVVVEDYGALESPAAPGVPLGTMLCFPLDDHGLLCVGSTTVEPFDESERSLLDILSSTATAALDRVARESELKSQRAALERSNEALQRRREQMEFFNSILRHDILNGMNVIRARGELLSAALTGDQAGYAETIVDWSDDIVDLTRKVRSVLQRLADDSAAETEPVELAPVVESAAKRASSMDLRSTFDVAVDDDAVVAADELLPDVFGNIFTNAVEHGSTGNRYLARSDDLVEDGEPADDGDAAAGSGVSVTVTTTMDDETVTVRVADDGPGVPPAQRTSIFERGEKSSNSAGTGFGLYFVDAMVESYGGSIWIEESDAGGAAFVVELPRVE